MTEANDIRTVLAKSGVEGRSLGVISPMPRDHFATCDLIIPSNSCAAAQDAHLFLIHHFVS